MKSQFLLLQSKLDSQYNQTTTNQSRQDGILSNLLTPQTDDRTRTSLGQLHSIGKTPVVPFNANNVADHEASEAGAPVGRAPVSSRRKVC